jgi:hypothetical protein
VRWGAISGPTDEPDTPAAGERDLPGDFVSEDLRADCARFLDELRTLIGRRAELPLADADWVPRRPH